MKKLILILALILVGCWDNGNDNGGSQVVQCSARINWEPPYYRLNGSELKNSDIEKYTIYVSSDEEYDTMYRVMEIDLTDTSLLYYEIRDIPHVGRIFVYMTVTDKDDRRSGYSNVLGKTC